MRMEREREARTRQGHKAVGVFPSNGGLKTAWAEGCLGRGRERSRRLGRDKDTEQSAFPFENMSEKSLERGTRTGKDMGRAEATRGTPLP